MCKFIDFLWLHSGLEGITLDSSYFVVVLLFYENKSGDQCCFAVHSLFSSADLVIFECLTNHDV